MKNIFRYSLLAFALVAGTSACTDLDEEIEDQFTEDFDPSNQGVGITNNVNKAQPGDGLQGAFAKVLDGTATNGGFFAVQEGGTDEAVITQKGGDWFDGGLYIRMHHHDFSAQTWAINDLWNQAYGGIFQCNTLLGDATMTDAQKAQLRTLRAFFYWRLMDVFANIPVVTIAGQDEDQSSRPEVYAFIEAELLAAIPDLPAGKQEYGRFNQAGAYALLSRLYLNSEIYLEGTAEYQKAIDAADMVINSGLYNLHPVYAEVFAPDNVENPEHIFVAPFDENTGTGMTIAQMTLHYPSQLTWRLQSQPWNGFSTLEDFYNSYEDVDARKEANFITGPQFDASGEIQLLDLAYDKGDPDGAPLNYTPFVNMLAPNASRQGGARFGKFAFKVGQKDNMDNDFPLLRYAEVLLNKAEALQRLTGNWDHATARQLVNEVRSRAGASEFTVMTEGDMLAERGRELFMETLRRTDLIRFGVYGNAWWEKDVDPKAEDHIIMAIPIEQILATDGTAHPLEQNPGY